MSLIVEVVLPFLAGVHCVTGQQVPLDTLLMEITPHLCRDTLVPALQILQSKVWRCDFLCVRIFHPNTNDTLSYFSRSWQCLTGTLWP